MRFTGVIVFLTVLILTGVSVVFAEDDTPFTQNPPYSKEESGPEAAGAEQDDASGEKRRKDFRVSVRGGFVGDAEIEDGDGSYAIAVAGASLGWRWFTLGYETRSFLFDDVDQLPFGNGEDDPWDRLHTISLRFTQRDMLSEKWGYFLSLGGSSQFEDELENSFGGSVVAGAVYRPGRRWTLGLGAGFSADPLDKNIYPAAFGSYNRRTPKGLFVTLGFPETALGWRFRRGLDLKLTTYTDNNTYRLADDSTVAEGGYYEQNDFGGGLFLDVALADSLTADVGVFYTFGREVEVFDREGDELEDLTQEDALGGGLRLSYRF